MNPPDPAREPALHALYVAARNRARARVELDRARRQAEALQLLADAHRRHVATQRAGGAGAVGHVAGERGRLPR